MFRKLVRKLRAFAHRDICQQQKQLQKNLTTGMKNITQQQNQMQKSVATGVKNITQQQNQMQKSVATGMKNITQQQDQMQKSIAAGMKNITQQQYQTQEKIAVGMEEQKKQISDWQEKTDREIQKLQSQMSDLEKVLRLERESIELMQGNIAELSDLMITPQVLHSHHKTVRGDIAIEKLLRDYTFRSVLDIGCGAGKHSDIFLDAGKEVTAIDYGESPYFKKNKSRIKAIVADFNTYEFDLQFDCVWCSHVLEHQLNPNLFLKKIHSVLKEDGVLCITVPPAKQRIGGGHVSLWNAGLLLYHLVLAGFDCSEAVTMRYDYNVSVIVKKRTIDVTDQLVYDAGDITTIRPYLPKNLLFYKERRDISFNGETLEEEPEEQRVNCPDNV